MKKLLLVLAVLGVASIAFAAGDKDAPEWNLKTTIIEACSCPMFCQCYFNSEPAGEHMAMAGDMSSMDHGTMGHFCKFNNAFQVSKGKYGKTKLDGAKFWVAGDLGGDFTKGEMGWAVLTFDPSVTKEQREGIQTILGHIYPVKWKDGFSVAADAKMDWSYTKDKAVAKLDDGKTAEVVLDRGTYGNTDAPVVISNLKYWGVPKNDGFVLMKNEVEAYRTGDKAFEFKGTNGFMITFDMSSKDVKM
jgi:hypothetical protein